MTENIRKKKSFRLLTCLLGALVFLCSSAIARADEVQIYGTRYQTENLASVELNKLLPQPYRVELPLVTRSGHNPPSPSTCAEWKALSAKHKDDISFDKSTQIYVAHIEKICWIVDKLSRAHHAQARIGSVDDLELDDYYPAGLAYNGFWRGREYIKTGKIFPPNVNDLTLEVSPFVKADTAALRRLIWGKKKLSLADLVVEVFTPSMSMIEPRIALGKNQENGSISGQFLRTSFETSVIATGMDVNGDQIEDWAVIQSINDATANAVFCYAAIISREPATNYNMNPFFVSETTIAARCG